MIRSFGCSRSCEQPWTTASSDHARPPADRPGWVRRDRVDRVGLVGRLPVGAPFPARAARCPPRDPGLAGVPSGSPRPVALGRWLGWVHYRTLGLRGRPSPTGGTPVVDETAASGATQPAVVPTLHTPALSRMITAKPPRDGAASRSIDQQERAPAAGGAAPVPIPLITPQIPGRPVGANGTTASRVAPKLRWSRPERACPRVGDGRPSNHMIR
jgi:hypothetical protein